MQWILVLSMITGGQPVQVKSHYPDAAACEQSREKWLASGVQAVKVIEDCRQSAKSP
jgi:hypothetical protein